MDIYDKPRYSPSANQRSLACSNPHVSPRFFIIGSNWLLHMAVLLRTMIGQVDLVEPWLRSSMRSTRPITVHERTAIFKMQLEPIIKNFGNTQGVEQANGH